MTYERFTERVERKLGELDAKVSLILNEIRSMKSSINSLTERTTRCESRLEDCEHKIDEHLEWHEKEKGWKIQWKITIIAALVASGSSALFTLLIRLIGG